MGPSHSWGRRGRRGCALLVVCVNILLRLGMPQSLLLWRGRALPRHTGAHTSKQPASSMRCCGCIEPVSQPTRQAFGVVPTCLSMVRCFSMSPVCHHLVFGFASGSGVQTLP